jgi:hypothetical protein
MGPESGFSRRWREGDIVTLPGSDSADAPKRLFEPGNFQRPFFILWAIFAIFYFSELAGFSLSIDEEKAIFRTSAQVWVQQGRWLAYLVERFLLPQPVLPFFPLFLFGALASLGYMIVARAHRYCLQEWPVLLVFILFSAFPILFFILEFSMVTVSLGIALLLGCLSIHLFGRALDCLTAPAAGRGEILRLFLLQALAGAGAVGVYQSLVLMVAAGCCGLFLLRHLRGPAMTPRRFLLAHGYLACVLLASLAVSFLLSSGFQWALAAEPVYIAKFVRPERFLESPIEVARKLLREYWTIYGGKRAVYGFRYLAFPALLVVGMVALAARARARGAVAVLLVVLYMLGITLIPFAINPLSGGQLPYRVLVAVPYVVWFFAAAAVLSDIALVRRIGIALAIVVSIQCLHTFSSFQAQKRLVLDHDRLLASEVYQRIVAEIPDFDRKKIYQADFYGAHEFLSVYKEIDGSTYSASFFEWDEGNPKRITDFMRILGYSNFESVGQRTRRAMLPVIEKMPIWPAAGSVRVVDGVILVRLGEKPGVVHKWAMEDEEP